MLIRGYLSTGLAPSNRGSPKAAHKFSLSRAGPPRDLRGSPDPPGGMVGPSSCISAAGRDSSRQIGSADTSQLSQTAADWFPRYDWSCQARAALRARRCSHFDRGAVQFGRTEGRIAFGGLRQGSKGPRGSFLDPPKPRAAAAVRISASGTLVVSRQHHSVQWPSTGSTALFSMLNPHSSGGDSQFQIRQRCPLKLLTIFDRSFLERL